MSTTTKQVELSPQAIWGVLADPYSYAYWVVGAKEVRGVDGQWPNPSARIHHSAGAGAVVNKDDTLVIEAEAPVHLKLRARFRPFGVAEVTIDLNAKGGGTEIVMHEVMVDGMASHIPHVITDVGLHPRNVKTLDRLAELASRNQ